jgi:carotenoid cleavage dioxygenase
MNAYNKNGHIVADVCRYTRVPLFDGDGGVGGLESATPARLTRWTFDLVGGTVKEEQLDDLAVEFPRLDERYTGLPYRHGYAGGRVGARSDAGPFNAIIHYDFKTEARQIRDLGPTSFTSEPVFVPRTTQAREGEGFLLAVVYQQPEDRSDLLIFDAENIKGEPLATVRLPHRVPYGFHGNWGQGL